MIKSNIKLNNPCADNPVCKKSKTLYTVIDNTRTRYTWDMELLVTFTDGTTGSVFQTPTTGWANQLNQWVTLFSDLLSTKCGVDYLVEARCNVLPNGCGGLLPPPSELEGRIPTMFWRYLNIGACLTCPAINKVEIVSINGNVLDTPRPLTMDYIEGEEKRYILCQDCGKEGILYFEDGTEVPEADMPLCLFECAETFPSTPEPACNFQLIEICDSDRPDDTTYVQFADCGDGQIINAYFYVDPDGGLEEYEPNEGSIGPCGSEMSSTIQCDSCGNQIEAVLFDDGLILYYEYSEKEGRGELTFPIGELNKCEEDLKITECGTCCSAIVGVGRGGINNGTNFIYGGVTGSTWITFTENLINSGFSFEFKTIYNTEGLPLQDVKTLEICGPVGIGTLTFTTTLGDQTVYLDCEVKEALRVRECNSDAILDKLCEIAGEEDCQWQVLCDEDGQEWLSCVAQDGSIETVVGVEPAGPIICESVVRICGGYGTYASCDDLTALVVDGVSTPVPINWLAMTDAERRTWIGQTINANATGDTVVADETTGNVCWTVTTDRPVISITQSAPTCRFLIALSKSIVQICSQTEGVEPLGDLGVCEDTDIDIIELEGCFDGIPTSQIQIYQAGVLFNTIYDQSGTILDTAEGWYLGDCIAKDTCVDCVQGDQDSSLCQGGENEFYPITGYSTAHTYDYTDVQTSEDITNLLGCQGEFSPTGAVIGVNLFYDFSAIPDCATINSIKVRHVGGNSSTDNVYHLHNPSTGALIPIDESITNRVWHRSNQASSTCGTVYCHVGEYPLNTFPTPAGRFESEITVTTPLSVTDLKNDFVVRFSAINTPDVMGCTKVVVDYTTDSCSQEELIAAGCAAEPLDANLVKICIPTKTVTDCAGNESTVEALPTTVENIVNVRICDEPTTSECAVDYFVGCDDVNGDGTLIIQYLTPVQTCSLNGTITSQDTLDIVDANLDPYTPVNPIVCNPSTLDFTEQVYCDGVNSFIRRTILVGTVGATVQELELDGVTPYTPMGASTLGPCDNGYQATILEGCVNGVSSVTGIDALTGTLLWGPKPLTDFGLNDCCEETVFTACTQIDVFDTFDLNTLNAGGMREISLEIDGTVVSTIPHDYLTTNDGVNKSSWYTPWVTAINALAGWSFTLLEDKGVNVSGNAGLSGNGKVTWTLEYSGTTPQRIRIYVGDVGNSLTTDFLEMDVTGQDTFTTSTGENNTVNIWSTYPFRNC